MNKTATVSLLAASALLFAPKPAVAGDKELAAIGGFIGGLIIGSQIDSNHHRRVVVQPACHRPASSFKPAAIGIIVRFASGSHRAGP